MTIDPPDHDGFSLLKMFMIRQKGIYKNKKQKLTTLDEETKEIEKSVGIASLF